MRGNRMAFGLTDPTVFKWGRETVRKNTGVIMGGFIPEALL